jgi:hypothetical protein
MTDAIIDVMMFIMGVTVAVMALGWLFRIMKIIIKGK